MRIRATKNSIVRNIKEKREFSGISDSTIREQLNTLLAKQNLSLSELSSKDIKLIIKQIRAELRKLHGMFKKSRKNLCDLLEKEDISKILSKHASTHERLKDYPRIADFISSLNPSAILDLGCGLNPLALSSRLPQIKYYASDIDYEILALLNEFFARKKIRGRAFFYDIRKIRKGLPKADLCLLFKVLDVLEPPSKKRGELTRRILKNLKCRFLLVSFSTKRLSGRGMNSPKRFWFEKILIENNINFQSFSTTNEIFYFVDFQEHDAH